MFRLTAPSEDEVRHFLAAQKDSGFSYPEVGMSATVIPARYDVDHNRVQIGRGGLTWQRAVEAIRAWQMFSMPWVRLYWPSAPIQVGIDVAFLVRHFRFHSLNACRIVYVVDEDGPVKRFGFAYGTLTEHAERGEERFTVEWNRDEDQVWYDILAFSRPREMLARLGYPLSRSLQRKFVEDSKQAMQIAVGGL
jgi:uncharacterized protein (UPF0548 family)